MNLSFSISVDSSTSLSSKPNIFKRDSKRDIPRSLFPTTTNCFLKRIEKTQA